MLLGTSGALPPRNSKSDALQKPLKYLINPTVICGIVSDVKGRAVIIFRDERSLPCKMRKKEVALLCRIFPAGYTEVD